MMHQPNRIITELLSTMSDQPETLWSIPELDKITVWGYHPIKSNLEVLCRQELIEKIGTR